MTDLLERRKQATKYARAKALAEYAAILQRASDPHEGDEVRLADVMTVLDLDDAQVGADRHAVAAHADHASRRLAPEQRHRTATEGQERYAERRDAQRAYLASLVPELPAIALQIVFEAINRELFNVDRGAGGKHSGRARRWGELCDAVRRIELETVNALGEDDRHAGEMRRLECDYPQAFGREPAST